MKNPETPDLSKLSCADACDVLQGRATELDVTTLSKEWQAKIATQEPGMVPGVSWSTPPLLVEFFLGLVEEV